MWFFFHNYTKWPLRVTKKKNFSNETNLVEIVWLLKKKIKSNCSLVNFRITLKIVISGTANVQSIAVDLNSHERAHDKQKFQWHKKHSYWRDFVHCVVTTKKKM